MSTKKLQVFAAHVAGVCDIQFHPSGESFITVGGEGNTLIHKDGLKEPIELHQHEDAISAISFNKLGDKFATGSEDHKVIITRYSDLKLEKEVTKFQLAVRTVAFSANGSFVAAAGDDGIIKVILMLDPKQAQYLKGHEGAVRYITYDPQDKYLASVGCDGTIRIWNTSTAEEVTCLKDCIAKTDVKEYLFNRIAWNPTGEWLAVPGPNNEIRCIERDLWSTVFTLKGGHNKPVSLLSWSPNGYYLASVGIDYQIVIWDLSPKSKRETLERYKHDSLLSGIAWHPKANKLAVVDVNGNRGIWESPIPPKFPNPFALTEELKKVAASQNALANMFNDDDEEFPNTVLEPPQPDVQSLEEKQKSEPIVEKAKKRLKKSETTDDPLDIIDGMDAEAIEWSDDHNVEYDEEEEAIRTTKTDLKATINRIEKKFKTTPSMPSSSVSPRAFAPVGFPPQAAFQPCASEPDKKRRFLVYNRIGTIVSRDEIDRTSLEIDFHDTSQHRPIKVTDHNSISMAAMNERGAVFASHLKGEISSTILYHPFQTWGTNSKWTIQLGATEDIQSLAMCDNFIAAATNHLYLRVYSYTGMQYFITSLSGPVVSMTGNGSLIAVVHHASNTPVGNHLKFAIFEMPSKTCIVKDDLPISSDSTLRWLGFSSNGVSCKGLQMVYMLQIFTTVDSKGIIRMAMDDFKQWIPILDLNLVRTSPQDDYWVFGLTDKIINCVQIKTIDHSPSTYPKPVPATLTFKMPFNQLELDHAQLEEKYLRERLFLEHEKSKHKKSKDPELQRSFLKQQGSIDTILIHLIELAMKQDKTEKAFNYSEFIQFEQLLRGLVNIANEQRKGVLAERLAILLHEKFEKGQEEESEEDSEEITKVKEEEDEEYDDETEEKENYPPKRGHSTQSISPTQELVDETSRSSNGSNGFQENGKAKKLAITEESLSKGSYDEEDLDEPPASVSRTSSNSSPLMGSSGNKKKRNRFAIEKPAKSTTAPIGNIFEPLNKLQASTSDSQNKKRRKFASFFASNK